MIFDNLVKPRQLERRTTTLRNPDPWFIDWVGGTETHAGEAVTAGTALTLSAYFAGVRAISEDVAKLPLNLYQRSGDDGDSREIARNHPVHVLIHDRPNRFQSAMNWRETITHHALSWGNGYAEITRDGQGVIRSLGPPIDPARVRVDLDSGEVLYHVTSNRSGQQTFQQRDMFHLHGLGYDGLVGYSVAHLARETIGLGLATERSSSSLFSNAARPAGILEYPEIMEDEDADNLRDSFEALYSGPENAHRTIVLENGAKFTPVSMSYKDAQFLESRTFTIQEIARWLRLNPSKLAEHSRSTFSNIEHLAIEHVQDALLPWLLRWEQEINFKLVKQNTRFFAEHVVEGQLRGDTGARYQAYAVGRQWGWLSANDVRQRENMNPVEGGDLYLVPQNMANAETFDEDQDPVIMPEQFPPAADTEDEEDNAERILMPVVGALVRRCLVAERSKSDKSGGYTAAFWDAFIPKHRAFMAGQLDPLLRSYARMQHNMWFAGQLVRNAAEDVATQYCEWLRENGELASDQDTRQAVLWNIIQVVVD